MNRNATATARQTRTLALANRHRDAWTASDLDFLAAFRDETIETLANALGRTAYAIRYALFVLDADDAPSPARVAYYDDGDRSFGAWARAHTR